MWELPPLHPGEGCIAMLSENGTGPHPCHILEVRILAGVVFLMDTLFLA